MSYALGSDGIAADSDHASIAGYKAKMADCLSRFLNSGSSIDEIFIGYQDSKAKYGKEVDRFPLGVIGIYCFAEKIGLVFSS